MEMTVLVVEDENNMRKILDFLLTHEGYKVIAVDDGFKALSTIKTQDVHIVLSDLRMPSMDGLTLLSEIRQMTTSIPVILLTAHGTISTAVEAMKYGAFDFLTKPFEASELKRVISNAAHTVELAQAEPRQLAFLPHDDMGIIGTSSIIRDLRRMIERVAASPSTVLVTGETGTGKELVAAALHQKSSRQACPFVKINCASIPEQLIESELFGFERGAFTGAVASKPGRFELADKGTLFLDEVGELSIDMQAKLLRIIQESTFERVGGIRTIRIDVRLIAATNRDLEDMVRKATFRRDLYYRLNIIPIQLPSLRDRREDIPLLIEHFIQKFNLKLNRAITGFSSEAMEHIISYDWPGNIRELENFVERSVLLAESDVIDTCDRLGHDLSRGGDVLSIDESSAVVSLKDLVRKRTESLERTIIQEALTQTGGNVTQAARQLKISRKSLQIKMKEYGLRSDH